MLNDVEHRNAYSNDSRFMGKLKSWEKSIKQYNEHFVNAKILRDIKNAKI